MSKSPLVKSLEDVMRTAPQADGMTMPELAKATGRNVDWVRERLMVLKAAGKLEVLRVPREAIDGIMRTVPVYRLKK